MISDKMVMNVDVFRSEIVALSFDQSDCGLIVYEHDGSLDSRDSDFGNVIHP